MVTPSASTGGPPLRRPLIPALPPDKPPAHRPDEPQPPESEDDSDSDSRSGAPAALSSAEQILAELYRERAGERRRLRWATAAAALFHLVLLFVTFPEIASRPLEITPPSRVTVVPQLRFQPPPPAAQQQIPTPKKKRIPIPDPTPDEPEPIEIPEVEIPDVEISEIDDLILGIPGPPAEPGPGTGGEGPYQLGSGIVRPEKIYAPQPRYTEEARQARIQGIVILQTVIDVDGNVTDVKPIKGLTLGLTESAIETVGQWKFKPATRDGEPVPVYLHVTVRFSLQ